MFLLPSGLNKIKEMLVKRIVGVYKINSVFSFFLSSTQADTHNAHTLTHTRTHAHTHSETCVQARTHTHSLSE